MEFQERFATEEACRDYLFVCRWPDGFRCRQCGGGEVGGMHRARRVWQCKRCGAQTSVTAGTVMHGTRTPLQLWFWAAYLLATHHPGISAVQLQRQLGIRYHETAWMLLHKLRAVMVAPQRESLKREVEVDEFFLGGYEEGLKGGRARGKKTLCGIAVEARGRGSGRVRLQVLTDASVESLGAFVDTSTEVGAIVHTDGWGGYNGLGGLGFQHRPRNQSAGVGEEPYPAACASRDLQPQGVVARHPPMGIAGPPAGVSERVRLPPQPARQPARRVPDAARSEHRPPARDLPAGHRSSRLTSNGTKPVCTTALSGCRPSLR